MRKRSAPLNEGQPDAKAARARFVTRKTALLEECAAERRTSIDVLLALEKFYATQTRDYLKITHTTYAVWLEHGPIVELEEVRGAQRDASVWDRLVETYSKRHEAGGRS